MSKSDSVVGDFHKPSNLEKHPSNSIGNQQVWDNGNQVGAIEVIPNAKTESVDLVFENSDLTYRTKL